MKILFLISILLIGACPQTRIEGRDKYGWTKFDQQTLERARERCGFYYPDSPCVKVFRKTSPTSYQVICGKD